MIKKLLIIFLSFTFVLNLKPKCKANELYDKKKSKMWKSLWTKWNF